MKDFLTFQERFVLREAHRAERVKRRADRVKAVLLLDAGWSYEKVAEALFLDDSTVRRYESDYQEGGLDLLIEDDYQGRSCKLSISQEAELRQHLEGTTYGSAKEIVVYIYEQFGIEYTEAGVVTLLHRLGFVYKKMKQVPGKADSEKQREFLERYAEIRKQMEDKDKLYFMDGTHPHHNSMPAYGWIPKGQTKEIKSNTGRNRININGALDVGEHDVIVREDESINADSTIMLLKEIESKNPDAKTIYIIADNARYYRAKKVREYLETSRIKMVFLPPYSPNLNLIERLWKFFHKKKLYNRYYESFHEFKKECLGFFENIGQYKDELATLLTENFQILGTNFSQT